VRLAVLLGEEARARTKLQALEEVFPRHPQVRAWDAAIGILARLGTQRPSRAARDLDHQIHAMVDLGLITEAREMLSRGSGTLADSSLARLRGDIAFAEGNWCAAQEAYKRALASGARFSPHSRFDAAHRRCSRERQAAERRRIDQERESPTLDTH
jgi:hypothetical protein